MRYSDAINSRAYEGITTQTSPSFEKGEKPHFPNVNKTSLREVPMYLQSFGM